ncbi:hypothetical protein JAAARDRAFT_124536 [Jaapia argillacea MUCL 33604]|uniref:triacylglycerol lipase n=1 Tax=Jaapia argillacea MUCL 33604 TaxID=933084 RepID=A0A067Q1W9_9AGAM|nr:hypothetical protein JAAARDRAFT_124536 [Jaapia argillacea MUCL 33604]
MIPSLLILSLSSIVFAAQDISFQPQHKFHLSSDHSSLNIQSPAFTSPLDITPTWTLKSTQSTLYRPRSQSAYQHARLLSLQRGQSVPVEWDQVKVTGPDLTDRHTVAQLGRMTGNAYALPGEKNWYEIDDDWSTVRSFPIGWDPSSEPGFRGHVFLTPSNTTAVLSIKGTTLTGPTSKSDKFNDNLLFSCCCARVDVTWVFKQVCGCYRKGWRCDNVCLRDALVEDSLFYSVGINLVNNLTAMYPNADIWLVGHSLGGALASLLGTTFGLPAIAFESPGELLAAQRLALPLPPSPPNSSHLPTSLAPVTHIYHTADPIPLGTCTGTLSPCSQAGYALETRCHLGKSIVYDTVGKMGWRVDVRTHTIKNVVTRLLDVEGLSWDDREGGEEGDGLEVPRARVEDGCVDCYKWEFGDYDDEGTEDDLDLDLGVGLGVEVGAL